jgi:hypothetical protein
VCVVFEWQTATIDDFVSKSFLLHGIVLWCAFVVDMLVVLVPYWHSFCH